MEGFILGVNSSARLADVRSTDGDRYTFTYDEWKAAGEPAAGQKIDFIPSEENIAKSVYLLNDIATAASRVSSESGGKFVEKCLQSYSTSFRRYAVFSGRASREDFWLSALTHYSILVSMYLVGLIIPSYFLVLGVYILINILPRLAVTSRRLHDMGRSAWWYFVCLIPIAGTAYLVFLLAQPAVGTNEYGESLVT